MNQFVAETSITNGHLELNNIPFADDMRVKVIVIPKKDGKDMNKLTPTDNKTKELIKNFCEIVFYLKKVHFIFCTFFHDVNVRSLMERISPYFFVLLNEILHKHFILEFAKLTDPYKTGKHENLSIDNLIQTVEWPPECRGKINMLNEKIKSFSSHIKPARNNHKCLDKLYTEVG